MPREFHFSFKVSKDFDCYAPVTEEECYLALVRCIATYPSAIYRLEEGQTMRFIDTRNIDPETKKPKTFQVGWM